MLIDELSIILLFQVLQKTTIFLSKYSYIWI